MVELSCKSEDPKDPGDGGTGGIPAGVARIAGRTLDGAGNGVADVDVRVTYELATVGPFAEPQTGAVSIFYTNQTLYTECNGIIPLSDGIPVRIFWDQNSNGPDASDPQPPLCDDPPTCESGPARTANFNEFTINGQALELGAGKFFTELAFVTVGDVLEPSLIYLRIYCNDGAILYTSRVMTIPEGPSDIEFVFDSCTVCDDPPIIPEWALGQAYPNPTTRTATYYYGLRDAAAASMVMQRVGSNRVDTLFQAARSSGGHVDSIVFGSRGNGLYDYRFRAGSYSANKQILLNVEELSNVRLQESLSRSASNGDYIFDTAAGVNIDRRDESGLSQGLTSLNRIHVLASKAGYFDVDSTITVASQDSVFLLLTMRPR